MNTETVMILGRCMGWLMFAVFVLCGVILVEVILRTGGRK